MTRWNSHEYYENGKKLGVEDDYLSCLIDHGRAIQEKKAPVIFSLAHLAKCSSTLYSDLHNFVSRKPRTKDFPYRHFPIKKRSGGTRWISVPVSPLWAVQSWIVKNILVDVVPHHCSHAYAAGCSPKKNAQEHCRANWLLKLDVEDFFGNVSEKQVFHVFRSLNYTPLLSFEMARLCTKLGKHTKGSRWHSDFKWVEIGRYYCGKVGCLPQGAPTSPMLSNLVSISMDEKLYQLATQHRANYTRYADDLTFSFASSSRSEVSAFKSQVISIVRQSGFPVNASKTKIVPPGARKIVTGLIVNETSPSLKKEYRD